MKTVHTITTAELESLENKYRNPSTLEESCILRGVQAEIKDREAYRQGKPGIYELEEELNGKDDEINRIESEVDELEDDVRDLQKELDKKA